MSKSDIRQKIKAKRQKLSAQDRQALSQQIINRVFGLIDWKHIHFVHSYLPIVQNNEVDLLPLLKAALQINPNLKIASTGIDKDRQTYWLDENLQPAKKVPEGFQYGLILVPILGFDRRGYRLGYGGGFYDRFLAEQEHAQVIGLAYEVGYIDKLPHEDHDVPLATIVTEKNIYRF